MSNHGSEGANSDSDNDHALVAEVHALSKPASVSSPRSQANDDGAARNPSSLATALVSSDSDDEFEFLRLIQRLYRSGGSDRAFSPRSVFTLQSGSSDPDDDEDFEVLRAIRRRFRLHAALGVNDDGSKEAGDMRGKNILNSHVDEGENRNSLSPETLRAAGALIEAIKRNRSAQKLVRSKLMNIDARMEKLKMIVGRVRVIWKFDVLGRETIELRRDGGRADLISVRSNKKSVSGANMKYGPPENSRVVNYRMVAFEKFPQRIPRVKWTTMDRRNLQKGVVQQFQKSLLLKSMDRIDESEGSSPSVDGIMSMIGGVEVNPQTLKSFLPNIDWDELASTYLPKRSGPECQARWMNHEDPLINREQWIHMEDKGIMMYVRRKGFNWVAIAESLGTNRTPFDCFARYQRSLNPLLIKREWTPSEDAELTAAVQTYGESNWIVVSSVLEGRTGPQCSNRWLKTLLPTKQKKGRWEPHEDGILKISVMLMGKCWNKIAEFIPGRTQASCRDRWVNCLDPALNLGEWTEEEDRKLEEGIKMHGYSWAKVASCIPPRTDNQCRRRWIVLFPDEAVQLRTAKKLRRALLPSNFVDRKPHRPTLEENDFWGLALEGGMGGVAKVDSPTKAEKKSSRAKKLCKVSGAAKKRKRELNRASIGEADLTLADFKMALKKRKRELNNGSLANQSKPSVPGGSNGRLSRGGTKACGSKTAGKRPRKRRLNSAEPQDCEESTLAELFGRAALHKRRREG